MQQIILWQGRAVIQKKKEVKVFEGADKWGQTRLGKTAQFHQLAIPNWWVFSKV